MCNCPCVLNETRQNKALCSCLDMETRCPGGRKVVQYRKAKLEKFAPYLIRGGLVTRLTTFRDIECKDTEWQLYFIFLYTCHNI